MSAGTTAQNQAASPPDNLRVQVLSDRIKDLDHSSALWNKGYLFVTGFAVLVAAASLYSQFKALDLTRKSSSAQSERDLLKDQQYQDRIAELNRQSSENNRLAGTANDRAEEIAKQNIILKGDLDKATADSLKTAEELRKQNLSTEEKLLAANASLGQETDRRLALEKSLAPRAISLKMFSDGTSNIDPLKKFSGYKVAFEYIQDAEAMRTASNLAWLLQNAGFTVTSFSSTSQPLLDGVWIFHSEPSRLRSLDATEAGAMARFANTEMIMRSADAGWAVWAFLRENDWEAAASGSFPEENEPNRLLIKVGFKPNVLHKNPLLKAAEEESDPRMGVDRNRDKGKHIRAEYLEIMGHQGFTIGGPAPGPPK